MPFHNPEYYSKNATLRYPFVDSATLRTASGFVLPNSLIVDLKIEGAERGVPYFLSLVTRSLDSIFFYVSTVQGSAILTFVVDIPSFTENRTYEAGTIIGPEHYGTITIGEIETFLDGLSNYENFSFNTLSARIHSNAIWYSNIDNRVATVEASLAQRLTGNVKFEAEVDTGLTFEEDTVNQKIILKERPSPTAAECECPPNYPEVTKVNGLTPDCNGNFSISGEGIISVRSSVNGVIISSTLQSNAICGSGGGGSGQPGPPGPVGPAGPTGPSGVCECPDPSVSAVHNTLTPGEDGTDNALLVTHGVPGKTGVVSADVVDGGIELTFPNVSLGNLLDGSETLTSLTNRVSELESAAAEDLESYTGLEPENNLSDVEDATTSLNNIGGARRMLVGDIVEGNSTMKTQDLWKFIPVKLSSNPNIITLPRAVISEDGDEISFFGYNTTGAGVATFNAPTDASIIAGSLTLADANGSFASFRYVKSMTAWVRTGEI